MSNRDAIFIEISPMLELSYTGIANTTCQVAKWWLEFDKVDIFFIYGSLVVDKNSVRMATELRCGAPLRAEIAAGRAIKGNTLDLAAGYDAPACLYLNVKNIQTYFAEEYQIIYDLTFLVTPEFHHVDTVTHHGLSLLDDLRSNTHTFAISECTKDDLIIYAGMPPEAVSVVYPGPSLPEPYGAHRIGFVLEQKIVVVPGTIEPRKNIRLLLSALQKDPTLLQRYVFVFFGRAGWLQEFSGVIREYELQDAVTDCRICWLDFVSDIERDEWYARAEFVVYPSLYEGFGLPVLEALHLGTPVVTSFSSSIPEVGGDAAFYFDPMSVESLLDAISRLECTSDRKKLKSDCMAQAAKFSWHSFNAGIASVILGEAA